jgi:hypothetical protein
MPHFLTPESFIAAAADIRNRERALPVRMTKLWSPFVIESDGVFVCISPRVVHESARLGWRPFETCTSGTTTTSLSAMPIR